MIRTGLVPAVALALLLGVGALPATAQKYGGTLQVLMAVNPPSLSVHEETTYYSVVAAGPMFNNLLLYDPLRAPESLATVQPELAESWSWTAEGTALTFRLRQGVSFHDGRPLTARDVKHTLDLARGLGQPKLRIAPRKDWFRNIEEIATRGDREVTFRLKRPQPSLLAMLATGYGAVYPAHIASVEWRTNAVGSGPFRIKEYVRDQYLALEKNPAYWVQGRPYLDAIRYHIIRARASQIAAFAAGQVDLNTSGQTNRPFMLAFKAAAPHLKFVETPLTVFRAVFGNAKVKPWDDRRMWQVLNLALEREGFLKTVFQGGAVLSGAMLPPPAGAWGLPRERLMTIPGYAPNPNVKEEARRIMASLGYSASNPLKTKLTVRGDTRDNVDTAVWVAGNLKEVWIEAELRQMETATFFRALAKFDYALAIHGSSTAADDPDAVFNEHYSCGSPRNYSLYCVEAVQQMFGRQSEMADAAQRLALVQEIDERLMRDVARVLLGHSLDYNAMQPYVMNFVPHQTLHSFLRMQEVWLDK